MKNIFEIMKEFGFEVEEDKKKDFEKAVLENYKTSADYDVQAEKLKTAEGKVTTLTESLDKFKDVNVDDLNTTIATLKTDLANKDQELKNKIADRDFNDLLKDSIASAHGKNAKAIMALLDVDSLKESKNQKEDIAAALKGLSEAEDSKMLFGTADPEVVGGGNPIGSITKPGNQTGATDAMRSIMGLPPVGK
nr:MAG TPA: minor structural protein [Caudoviricetes sp.]